jgi:RNA polymerase sigma factor (sigma-70 family)
LTDNNDISNEEKQVERCLQLLQRNRERLALGCVQACKGNLQDAEDLLQDIFCSVWCGWSSVREDSSDSQLDHWLFAKARTVTYDFLRERRVAWHPIDKQVSDISECFPPFDEGIEPLLVVLNTEERELMELLLQGYSKSEIGEMKGVAKATMRKRFSRMIQKIKHYVEVNKIEI